MGKMSSQNTSWGLPKRNILTIGSDFIWISIILTKSYPNPDCRTTSEFLVSQSVWNAMGPYRQNFTKSTAGCDRLILLAPGNNEHLINENRFRPPDQSVDSFPGITLDFIRSLISLSMEDSFAWTCQFYTFLLFTSGYWMLGVCFTKETLPFPEFLESSSAKSFEILRADRARWVEHKLS